MDDARASLKAGLPEFEKYGTRLDKALDAVLSGNVKEVHFLPSGKKVITVVGRLGDEFVDPEKPYCSCSNFFFRVLGGREEVCYHLLSYQVASKLGKVDILQFSDEEYEQYLVAVVGDVFEVLRKSGS